MDELRELARRFDSHGVTVGRQCPTCYEDTLVYDGPWQAWEKCKNPECRRYEPSLDAVKRPERQRLLGWVRKTMEGRGPSDREDSSHHVMGLLDLGRNDPAGEYGAAWALCEAAGWPDVIPDADAREYTDAEVKEALDMIGTLGKEIAAERDYDPPHAEEWLMAGAQLLAAARRRMDPDPYLRAVWGDDVTISHMDGPNTTMTTITSSTGELLFRAGGPRLERIARAVAAGKERAST